jgi:hypothetical protein
MERRFRAAGETTRDPSRRSVEAFRGNQGAPATDTRLAAQWTQLIAPRRDDVRVELVEEAIATGWTPVEPR